jgi:3-deoxy-manno-octulosonate cytidylyltransferase (CMP-KDO synthetase)
MSIAVGIIPARWGSTRFPGKPLYPIAGKPLLRHVWERSRRARSLDSVIIATDDMRIAKAAFDWGAEVAMTLPRHQSGTDRIAEVAAKAKQVEFVINIQGDEPLVDPRLIDKFVQILRADRKVDIVTAAHPFSNPAEASSPHQVKVVVDLSGRALYFSRAPIPSTRSGAFPVAETKPGRFGKRPSLFLRHQGIYGFRHNVLLQFVQWKPTPLERAESLEQLRALENGVRIQVVVTASGSPGVDTPEDAEAIERQLLSARRRAARKKRSSKR